MASTAVNSPNRLVSPRAWMSDEVAAVLGGGPAGDTRVSGMGAHGTAGEGGPRRGTHTLSTCLNAAQTCYTGVAQRATMLLQPARRAPAATGAPAMATVPDPVSPLLDKALVAELTVVDGHGRPVTYPLIPLWDGERCT